jgi:hypothetical protein
LKAIDINLGKLLDTDKPDKLISNRHQDLFTANSARTEFPDPEFAIPLGHYCFFMNLWTRPNLAYRVVCSLTIPGRVQVTQSFRDISLLSRADSSGFFPIWKFAPPLLPW